MAGLLGERDIFCREESNLRREDMAIDYVECERARIDVALRIEKHFVENYNNFLIEMFAKVGITKGWLRTHYGEIATKGLYDWLYFYVNGNFIFRVYNACKYSENTRGERYDIQQTLDCKYDIEPEIMKELEPIMLRPYMIGTDERSI